MAMKHTYFTGAALGSRAQYEAIGGTDSLDAQVIDANGTYTLVSNSSTYGSTALRITTTTDPNQGCSVGVTHPANQTERRINVILDMPTMTLGQSIGLITIGSDSGTFTITITQDGAWSVYCNGSNSYTSGTGLLPAAGTRIRIAAAVAINGSSSTWRARIYNDQTGTAVDTERSGTTTWTGTFWDTSYYGKVTTTSGTSLTLLFRAIRAEDGGGCGTALLPAESLLTPSEGSAIVPIRIVSNTGTSISPTGASAVTNLSDGIDATTVTVPTGATVRVALRPMNIVGPYLTFNLYKLALTVAGSISVKLYSGNAGTQIGTTKSVSVGTSAADATVTFSSPEISGLTSTDWESIELELIVP